MVNSDANTIGAFSPWVGGGDGVECFFIVRNESALVVLLSEVNRFFFVLYCGVLQYQYVRFQ